MSLDVQQAHIKAERLRASSGRAVRKEDLGEHVLARLRSLSKEGKAAAVPAAAEKSGLVSGSIMLERAAVKDAKDWEEESCVAEGAKEQAVKMEKANAVKGSLLD